MHYNAGWQLVEEDIYEGWTAQNPGSVDQRRAYLWGARYIDDAIAMLIDGDADGDYDPTDLNDDVYFFLTDAQFSVVAVLDGSADLEERVTYDAYGTARHHDWRDVDGDGDYDATDYTTITNLASGFGGTPITSSSYNVDADVDRDGDIDSTDQTLAGTTYPTALANGELSYAAIGNIIGYDGYVFNAETEQYTVRHRHYDTVLGRWLERDPAGYVDGMNSYLYARAQAADRVDPSGFAADTCSAAGVSQLIDNTWTLVAVIPGSDIGPGSGNDSGVSASVAKLKGLYVRRYLELFYCCDSYNKGYYRWGEIATQTASYEPPGLDASWPVVKIQFTFKISLPYGQEVDFISLELAKLFKGKPVGWNVLVGRTPNAATIRNDPISKQVPPGNKLVQQAKCPCDPAIWGPPNKRKRPAIPWHRIPPMKQQTPQFPYVP